MAERMLGAFLEGVRPGEILAVEESFAVEPVEGILVTGVVDLVEVKDGRFWIVDAKTGKNQPSEAFDKEQVGLYRLGLEELGLIPEGADVGLRYDVLRKLKKKQEFVQVEVEVAPKELSDLRGKLGAIWRAMDAGIIYRSRNWACDGCQWAKACAEADLTELLRRRECHSNGERSTGVGGGQMAVRCRAEQPRGSDDLKSWKPRRQWRAKSATALLAPRRAVTRPTLKPDR
jgi:CRISPR/Cas system-associated exonuclease Cas4 (RecB family)